MVILWTLAFNRRNSWEWRHLVGCQDLFYIRSAKSIYRDALYISGSWPITVLYYVSKLPAGQLSWWVKDLSCCLTTIYSIFVKSCQLIYKILAIAIIIAMYCLVTRRKRIPGLGVSICIIYLCIYFIFRALKSEYTLTPVWAIYRIKLSIKTRLW